MLIYQHDANVLALCRKAIKSRFDRSSVRLAVDYQEVLLRVWSRGNMLCEAWVSSRLAIGQILGLLLFRRAADP